MAVKLYQDICPNDKRYGEIPLKKVLYILFLSLEKDFRLT
ncbi:hypothetical protein N824_24190 [Pedobacter sp. V48]|nr:hypothetical protein N824_24190 [Pedobacter sp. V48]